jgi:hypothetical protein
MTEEASSSSQTLEPDEPEATQPSPVSTTRRPKRSNKTMINFWLDAGMLVLFVALGIIAVIVQFVFPPGVAARGWTLWGMSYGQWCSVQFTLLCMMAFAVLVHVMLHWPWVCGVVWRQLLGRSRLPNDGVRTIVGVGVLIVLLNVAGIFVAIASFMITAPVEP